MSPLRRKTAAVAYLDTSVSLLRRRAVLATGDRGGDVARHPAGGAEDKTGGRRIIGEIAERAKGGSLAICTAGSVIPEEVAAMYTAIFRGIGLRSVVHVPVATREDADDSDVAAAVARAKAFFFTGGDQLRIASNVSG